MCGRCARTRIHLSRHRYLMAGMDLLERLRGTSYREHIEVLEHEPPSELVAATDIVRTDQLGRNVVACAAGQVPPTWLTLTAEERDALVEAQPPPPQGHMNRAGYGFSPEGITVGEYATDNGGRVDGSTRTTPSPTPHRGRGGEGKDPTRSRQDHGGGADDITGRSPR